MKNCKYWITENVYAKQISRVEEYGFRLFSICPKCAQEVMVSKFELEQQMYRADIETFQIAAHDCLLSKDESEPAQKGEGE